MNTNSLVVVKHNKVIEACYQLSLSEQRILLACIAQIDSTAKLTEKFKFEVTVGQIEDLAGIENAYRDVKEASEKLLKRIIKIDRPDPDKPNLEYTLTHWVDSCDYYPKEGKVVLAFSRPIIPYLSQLSHSFTQYKIKNVAQMKSTYSIRLYEWLCQWLSTGEREIDVQWLRTQWQLLKKYQRMTDLKKWVIDVAVKEINDYSNLWVTYNQKKSGRTVTHFQFRFGLKNQTASHVNGNQKPALSKTDIEKQALPGETWDQAKKRLLEIKKMKDTLKA